MAFNTSQGLISTLTTDKTLAFATLGVLYGVFTCTTIVAPKLVDVMGPRLAITLGAVPYVLFVFANILPVWGTLLPASAPGPHLWLCHPGQRRQCAPRPLPQL